jgi:hypothetical protein
MVVLTRSWPGLAASQWLLTCRWFATALVMASFADFALAQDAGAALQIEAAFLHKFPTYVQGPDTAFEDSATPLVFGVAGSESVYAFLTELVAAQNSGMRTAEVRRVTGIADMAGVNVLFVGEDARAAASELLQSALAASMLTVTSLAGPHPANSMIHFFVADDRVRFDIALAPAEAAGLRLSSRLLQVARQVIDAETGGD